jgi:hypothetical protein
MYKTPPKFHIGMRGGAPDLGSPLKILFADWRLIPLARPDRQIDHGMGRPPNSKIDRHVLQLTSTIRVASITRSYCY